MSDSAQKTTVNHTSFAIIGSGWRAEFYLRIAKTLPDIFSVCGVVSRSEDKRRKISDTWGVDTFASFAELVRKKTPDFAVIAVAKDSASSVIKDTAETGVSVLAETPPANTLEELNDLREALPENAKIQVAEQYHFQPMHSARLALIRSGIIGQPSHAQISFTQNYHAMSLMRKYLGIGFENAKIRTSRFNSPVIEGFGRTGLPEKENLLIRSQTIALFDFGDKSGMYDFEHDQHRSWARFQRIIVRGEKGELFNDGVKYLKDFRTPVEYNLKRINAGENENLEGYFCKGIIAADSWAYINPFAPASLSDDEIAIASCLAAMKTYADTGKEFYGLAEAMQDQYLALMMEKALADESEVTTSKQEWS